MEHAVFVVTGGLTPVQRSLQLFMCLRRSEISLPLDVRRLLGTYIERLPSEQDLVYMTERYKSWLTMDEHDIFRFVALLVLEHGRHFNLAHVFVAILENKGYTAERRIEVGQTIFTCPTKIPTLRRDEAQFCMLEFFQQERFKHNLIMSRSLFSNAQLFTLIGGMGGYLHTMLLGYAAPIYVSAPCPTDRLERWNAALAEDLTGRVKAMLKKTLENPDIGNSTVFDIMDACMCTCPILFKTILELRLVDFFAQDEAGRPLLYIALKMGPQWVQWILENGGACNINFVCFFQTPLITALIWNQVETLELLLQHGADPMFVNNVGDNVYDWLRRRILDNPSRADHDMMCLEIIEKYAKKK